MSDDKPLAFVDIDGVLNRFGFADPMDAASFVAREVESDGGMTFLLHLDPRDANRLARLSEHFELAWGTTWQDDAPQVADLIGVESRSWPIARREPGDGELFKSPGIMRVAAGRPFVWIDDDLWPSDLEALDGYDGDCLTIGIDDPSVGLRDEHVETAIEWARRRTSRP